MNEPRSSSSAWKKSVVTVAGFGVTLIGVVMLVTPGPGLPVTAAGLAILATEYVWAQRLLQGVRDRIKRAAEKATKKDRG